VPHGGKLFASAEFLFHRKNPIRSPQNFKTKHGCTQKGKAFIMQNPDPEKAVLEMDTSGELDNPFHFQTSDRDNF
jgi:hypothetical protein